MTPPTVACSMSATSCGSVASGSEDVASIRTIAWLWRIFICCTIFAPSTSELTEYRAALVLASLILASRNAVTTAVAICRSVLPFCSGRRVRQLLSLLRGAVSRRPAGVPSCWGSTDTRSRRRHRPAPPPSWWSTAPFRPGAKPEQWPSESRPRWLPNGLE